MKIIGIGPGVYMGEGGGGGSCPQAPVFVILKYVIIWRRLAI